MNESYKLTFQDYLDKINIQEVLQHAGYVLNKRDGLRYPSYVRLDGDGRRIRGDKFIVTPHNNRCFQPPILRTYNVVSFIKEHPGLFKESAGTDNPYKVVHDVCHNILNLPSDERNQKILLPRREETPFKLDNYTLHNFKKYDFDSQRLFYPYFVTRGIHLSTEKAFSQHFMLASKNMQGRTEKRFTNLSFPLRVPGESAIVGFEERGRPHLDGSSGYKGKALGSNSSDGLWIANLGREALSKAEDVYWFESAYDAMAYYQMRCQSQEVRRGIFVSTGGNPSYFQMEKMLRLCPNAVHHVAFDNDTAGNQYAVNFKNIARNVEESLNKEDQAQSPLKDLGTYDVPEWALNLLENGEDDELSDEEMAVADRFIKDKFPDGFVTNIHWDAPHELNRNPSFGTKMEQPFVPGDSFYQAVKTYPVQFMHPFLHEGMKEIRVDRELPPVPCKDWNEVIINEMKERMRTEEESQEIKESAGLDFDNDGEVETMESEEKRQHHVHHR